MERKFDRWKRFVAIWKESLSVEKDLSRYGKKVWPLKKICRDMERKFNRWKNLATIWKRVLWCENLELEIQLKIFIDKKETPLSQTFVCAFYCFTIKGTDGYPHQLVRLWPFARNYSLYAVDDVVPKTQSVASLLHTLLIIESWELRIENECSAACIAKPFLSNFCFSQRR